MAATDSAGDRPDLKDIQGNLVGFNKDLQRLVFLHFQDAPTAQAFLHAIEPDVASGREVKAFNSLFKEITMRRGGEPGIVQASWTNLALTAKGIELLGAEGLDAFPQEFRDGMASRAEEIGDKDDSAPNEWLAPFDSPADVHAMAILAADAADDLDASYARLKARTEEHAVTELEPAQDGKVREGDNRGHEHFDFKDGISQPGIVGVTVSSKRGQDQIATGEFIIGYPDQDGQLSGQPAPEPPQPGAPGYNPIAPPPPPGPMPDWTKNGSFLVYRRLQQNVGAFNEFMTTQAGSLNIAPDALAAAMVGRWKSGAPVERVPGEADTVDPRASDPADADPSVLDDKRINDFAYADDQDGHLVPRAAHIRKTNPRSEEPPGRDEANRHRILRRGIPYGPEFEPGEPAYPGAGVVPDNQDRGLLFLCYQASIARGFEFVQSQWANREEFPQDTDGRDPIISQDVSPRDFNLTPQNQHLEVDRWVKTMGGEYFFAPSLSGLRILGGESSDGT